METGRGLKGLSALQYRCTDVDGAADDAQDGTGVCGRYDATPVCAGGIRAGRGSRLCAGSWRVTKQRYCICLAGDHEFRRFHLATDYLARADVQDARHAQRVQAARRVQHWARYPRGAEMIKESLSWLDKVFGPGEVVMGQSRVASAWKKTLLVQQVMLTDP